MTQTQDRLCVVCGAPNRRRQRAKYCCGKCATVAFRPSPAVEATRSARKRGAAIIEVVDPAAVAQRDAGICYLCGEPVVTWGQSGRWDATLDHVVPVSRGGEHSYANTRLAHRACNSRKGTRTIEATAG